MIHKTLRAAVVAASSLLAVTAWATPRPPLTCFEPGQKFDARFLGNWEVAQWHVRYTIRAKGRQICLFGRDIADNEWFEVSGLKWDGKVFAADFRMPSTQWRTHSRLSVVGADKLRDDYKTPDGHETDFWTRRK